MAYPTKNLTDGERVIREFRPHWRLLVIPLFWLIAGIVAIVLINGQIPPDGGPVDLGLSILVVAAFIPLVIQPVIRWWFTSYVLTNERLITRTGVIARAGVEIPLENINNILFSQTIIERLLRSGDLLIESAGESGQSQFRDIPNPDEFQSLLTKVREERSKEISQVQVAGLAEAAKPDATERLERLARLHRDGVITEEEYKEKRQQLLDEI
ncbi:MAG: PH domain-containing protein [Acidimicrobiia bacterium]|nr:PH domain-containing protein [Acidimicrobiia bacterium]